MTGQPPDPLVMAAARRADERASRYHEILRRVARAAGGRIEGDDGVTVAHAVKRTDSLAEKVRTRAERGGTPAEHLLRINDLNRYTVVFDDGDYLTGVRRARELLAEHGLSFDHGKNRWTDPAFRGYSARFSDQHLPHAALDPAQADPSARRHPVEVQFHTPDSLSAKQDTRPYFELIRRPPDDMDADELAAAKELRAQRNERVPAPPGHEHLPGRVVRQERPATVSEPALAAARRRAAVLRAGWEGQRADPSRGPPMPRDPPDGSPLSGPAPPTPPVRQLRRLTPEQSGGGHRDDDGGGRQSSGREPA